MSTSRPRSECVGWAATCMSAEASIPLNEVELRLGVRFPEGDFETLAGYLLEEFGRIPVRGDSVTFDRMELEVLTADRRRIESVQIDLRARKG